MNKFSYKYILAMIATVLAFLNFVSCGAQMYQLSLEEDHDAKKIPEQARDPGSEYYGLHAVEGWGELPISFVVGNKMTEEQIEGLSAAIKIWEKAVGQTLFNFKGVDNKDGDSFEDLYSSLFDARNGHYLDYNWDKTGKSAMVLATTIWDTSASNLDLILTSDIRFNSENYYIADSFTSLLEEGETREMVDMTTLALHELGHMLGLTHVSKEYDRLSIMNPSIYVGEGLASRYLSCGDIARIQLIYGCEGDSCDQEALCTEMNGTISEEEPY